MSCVRIQTRAGGLRWLMARAMAASLGATLIVLGAACTSTGDKTQDKPDWVDGAAARYPAGEFLLGRGNAETVELAQERARADLAKVFEISVQVDSSDSQRARHDGTATRYEAASEQRIVTRTDKVISGLRIAELWNAPASEKGAAGRQHALAVLSRGPAGKALRDEIADRDEAIRREVARARASNDALERAGLAARAVDLARQRAGFEKSLRVVDLGGRGVDAPISLARLQGDLNEQLKRVALNPALLVTGPLDEAALLTVLKGAIAQAGFMAGSEPALGSAGVYAVQIRARLDEQLIDGWHWVRGNLELTLTDSAGRVRGSQAWPVRASAQGARSARARAVLEIEQLLKQELRPAILGFSAS